MTSRGKVHAKMLSIMWQIQLTPSQVQAITMQMQGKQPGQSIVIRTTQLEQPQQQDVESTSTSEFSPQVLLVVVVVAAAAVIAVFGICICTPLCYTG